MWHVILISQIKGVKAQTPMGDFSQMRQALSSGVIDGYISERPEAMTAQNANSSFKMVTLEKGFTVSESDAAIAVGMRKDDPRINAVNIVLSKLSDKDRLNLMDKMVAQQPKEKKMMLQNRHSSRKCGQFSKKIGANSLEVQV